MTKNSRTWVKSKVNSEQVGLNSKNAKLFVELTEKYKVLGSSVEGKLNDVFNILGANFMMFDPEASAQEEVAKANKQELVTKALQKSIVSAKLDFDKINDASAHDAYANEIADSLISNSLQYLPVLMLNDDFKQKLKDLKLGDKGWEGRRVENQKAVIAIANKVYAANATAFNIAINDLEKLQKSYLQKDTWKVVREIYEVWTTREFSDNPKFKEGLKAHVKASITLLKEAVDKIDPTNPTQIKTAMTMLNGDSDLMVLSEWLNLIEAKSAFTNSVEELHNDYEAFLNLDDRAVRPESKADNTWAFQKALNSFASLFTSGSKDEQKSGAETKDEPKKEKEGIFSFKPILNLFNPWAKSKVTETLKETKPTETDAEEEDSFEDTTTKPDSTKMAVYGDVAENKAAVAVKTLAVEAYESMEQVHKEYQVLMSAFMDAKKVICFSNVMQATKLSSSCLIRKPFEDIKSTNKLDCETLVAKAAVGMKQCEYMFPFATASDEVISKFLDQASKVEVMVFEDGQTGLKSHVDQVADEITAGLGKAVLAHYMALPAGATEQVMTNAYNEQVVDGNGNLQLTAEVFAGSNNDGLVAA